jgi:hypothetical protein
MFTLLISKLKYTTPTKGRFLLLLPIVIVDNIFQK